MPSPEMPQPGQVVHITQGRDAGRYAVVLRTDRERFAWIADGDKRKYDKPKKKNFQHLECMPYFSPEVVRSLDETGRVSNGKLRFAIQKFISYYEGDGANDEGDGVNHDKETRESQEKGEGSSG